MHQAELSLTILLLVSLSNNFSQKDVHRSKVNHPPEISSFSSSTDSVSLCPWFPCAPPGAEIAKLTLVATDSDRDALQFECTVPVGKLSGCGTSMSWDLNNVLRGTHTIIVKVKDGHGGEATAQLAINVQDCTNCDPPPPPCPIIRVTCPEEIEAGKRAVFSATLSQSGAMQKWEPMTDEELYKRASFKWSVTTGQIIKGQNSRRIEVDTTNAKEQVHAIIEVFGFDPACPFRQSCTVTIKNNPIKPGD